MYGIYHCCLSVCFFHPGSRVKNIPHPGSGSTSKNSSILIQKIISKLSEIWFGMFIPIWITDLDLDFLPIQYPGSRGQTGTGSWIPGSGFATLELIYFDFRFILSFSFVWNAEIRPTISRSWLRFKCKWAPTINAWGGGGVCGRENQEVRWLGQGGTYYIQTK